MATLHVSLGSVGQGRGKAESWDGDLVAPGSHAQTLPPRPVAGD